MGVASGLRAAVASAIGGSWLTLVGALAIAFAMRAYYVLGADFPLNDGGLFHAMISAVQAADYRLPATVAYNSLDLPFAYPPLSFYLGALLADLTGMTSFDVLRLFPLVASTALVAAFYLLARSMLASRAAVAVATYTFAVLPGGFAWMIMGGGLARALGFLFALLAVHQLVIVYVHGIPRRVFPASALCALTALSHPEAALLVAYTALLLFVMFERNRRGAHNTLLIAASTLALTAPWWLTVLAHHGIEPFIDAGVTGDTPLIGVLAVPLVPLFGTAFPVIAPIALLGALACWLDRKLFLVAWLCAIFALDPRGAQNYAAVPIALLVGIGAIDVVLPLLRPGLRTSLWRSASAPLPAARASDSPTPLWFGVAALLVVYTGIASLLAARTVLQPVSTEQRQAMSWVAATTPSNSRFVVITDTERSQDPWGWASDGASEWFPVVAERQSVGTPQGTEWLGTLRTARRQYAQAQLCAGQHSACLDDWARRSGVTFDYVYLAKSLEEPQLDREPRTCCAALDASLRGSREYQVAYDGPGATIFARRPIAATD